MNKLLILPIITMLITALFFLPQYAAAEDDKNKKPQTLAQFCSKLDGKDEFKSLVCVAILGITNSIHDLQNQITHIQLVPGPQGPKGDKGDKGDPGTTFSTQTCPTNKVMIGINSDGTIICQSSSQCITPPTSLVGWWPADGNTNDLAGSHTGTISGGVTFAPGKVAQAFSFDGTGSVGVGSLGISNNNQPFSMIAWVNPTASAINDGLVHTIAAEGSTPNNSGNGEFMTDFDIVGSNGLGQLEIEIGVTQISAALKFTAPVIHPGQWTLVAVTYDGSRTADGIKIYVNGVQQPDTIVRNDMGGASPRDEWTIGSQTVSGGYDLFAGLIDETEIFNRVITQQEIQSEFNADSAGKCKSATPPSNSHTVTLNSFRTWTTATSNPNCNGVDAGPFDDHSNNTVNSMPFLFDYVPGAGLASFCRDAEVIWDTSSIPAGATVTSVQWKANQFYHSYGVGTADCAITSVVNPTSTNAYDNYNDPNTGTVYVSGSWCRTSDNQWVTSTVDLGPTAISDMNNHLGGKWGIGLRNVPNARDGFEQVAEWNNNAQNQLQITYTLP